MYDGDHLRVWVSVEESLRIYRSAPLLFNSYDRCSGPRCNVAHATSKDPVYPDDHHIARFDEIDERGFHSR